jgi:hypothetical protein
MEKIAMQIKEQQQQQQVTNIELKSCMIDQNVKPNIMNWTEGTPLKSEDTIISSQLYRNNCVIMAKIVNAKVNCDLLLPSNLL